MRKEREREREREKPCNSWIKATGICKCDAHTCLELMKSDSFSRVIDWEAIPANPLWLRVLEPHGGFCGWNYPPEPPKSPLSRLIGARCLPANTSCHSAMLPVCVARQYARLIPLPSAVGVCEISYVNHNCLQRAGVMSSDQIRRV